MSDSFRCCNIIVFLGILIGFMCVYFNIEKNREEKIEQVTVPFRRNYIRIK